MAHEGRFARIWAVIIGVFAVLGFAASLMGINVYLDRKIEAKLSDADFIRNIASQIRPALIFDSNGSILADLGGMQYFEDISVAFPDIEKKPGEIVLKPRVLLTFPPEITGMGGAQIFPVARRGPGFTWHYDVDGIFLMKANVPKPYHFRLEVIR